MSKGIKFKLNRAGVKEVLQSPEMLGICTEYAGQILSRAGEGYDISTYTGKSRVNASVYASTYEARKDNYDNNTLLKALGGAR